MVSTSWIFSIYLCLFGFYKLHNLQCDVFCWVESKNLPNRGLVHRGDQAMISKYLLKWIQFFLCLKHGILLFKFENFSLIFFPSPRLDILCEKGVPTEAI